jgi:hemoglobin
MGNDRQTTEPGNDERVTLNGVAFSHREIALVVDGFYSKVANDPVLQAPFRSVRNWPEHIERMTHFWWTKFGGRPYLAYQYDPVTRHFAAGFNLALLSRWLTLFHHTLGERLRPDQYELWAVIAERMGQGLAYKNELYGRDHEATRRVPGTAGQNLQDQGS